MSTKYLVTITSNYFCAGIVTEDQIVVEAAPILKYMLGWPTTKVRRYSKKKGWVLNIMRVKDDTVS